MPKAVPRDGIYRGRRFSAETIELCVPWYLTYRLSYRDLSAMMAERGITISHTTILRWVLRYVPEYERRCTRFARPVGESWRMDETAVNVRGGPHWLYRAVDRSGKSVHSLLCAERTIESAQAFFRGAVARPEVNWPSTINLDGNQATHQGLRLLGRDDPRWCAVKVRANRYINNLVEQDHRAIKRRCRSMLGLKSFESASVTLAGIELAHRIRKNQFGLPIDIKDRCPTSQELWDSAVRFSGDADINVKLGVPPMHQISSVVTTKRNIRVQRRPPRWFAVKLPVGNGLYMVATPSGARYWRWRYRYRGAAKTLSLGRYPFVSSKNARAPHQAAKELLAVGVDPWAHRRNLGQLTATLHCQPNA